MNENSTGLVPNVLNWFAHPFRTEGSALNWILFVGLLVVAAWWWTLILRKVTA